MNLPVFYVLLDDGQSGVVTRGDKRDFKMSNHHNPQQIENINNEAWLVQFSNSAEEALVVTVLL